MNKKTVITVAVLVGLGVVFGPKIKSAISSVKR